MKVLSFDMEIGQIQEQRPIFIPGTWNLYMRARRFTAILYSLGALLLAMWAIYQMGGAVDSTRRLGLLFIALNLILLGIGLAKDWPVALKTAAFICCLFAIFMPIIALSPMSAKYHVAEGKSLLDVLIKLLLMESFLLVSAYLLDLPPVDKRNND
jgi:hypothetical protein